MMKVEEAPLVMLSSPKNVLGKNNSRENKPEMTYPKDDLTLQAPRQKRRQELKICIRESSLKGHIQRLVARL